MRGVLALHVFYFFTKKNVQLKLWDSWLGLVHSVCLFFSVRKGEKLPTTFFCTPNEKSTKLRKKLPGSLVLVKSSPSTTQEKPLFNNTNLSFDFRDVRLIIPVKLFRVRADVDSVFFAGRVSRSGVCRVKG